MQWKINDTVICLRMGKTNTAKIPPGDFQVTTPEIPLLSQQAITSKGILEPYTNLQLNSYPNTQPTREGCWLQSSSVHPHDEDQKDAWSQNPTVHIHSNFFIRMIN